MKKLKPAVSQCLPQRKMLIMMNRSTLIVLGTFGIAMLAGAEPITHSQLWGKAGEAWEPANRLPDVSFAGYRHGGKAIPHYEVVANVRDFGAKGDGESDDTEAFKRAIEEAGQGAILIPAGTYRLTDRVTVDRPQVVLRGEGPEKTVLYFAKSLEEIDPQTATTGGGTPTTRYSWSGGLLRIAGRDEGQRLTGIVAGAERGARSLTVESSEMLETGQWIRVQLQDDDDLTLARHLYDDDPGPTGGLGARSPGLIAQIVAIEDNVITINRSLRTDVRPEWQPHVMSVSPTVTDSGIENLKIEFPGPKYGGHFKEDGYNAIEFQNVQHCWVRNVHIHNADSGGFFSSWFSTFENITLTADRDPDNRGHTGHHGIRLGHDNLVTGADFQTRFIHDLTVSGGSSGNVVADSRGIDLNFDHHRQAPFENVFTNIHVGEGRRVWSSGGTHNRGRHSGARTTFWNIRANRDLSLPGDGWGPASLNFIGVQGISPDATGGKGWWVEAIKPETLQPANLHKAQLERRLKKED